MRKRGGLELPWRFLSTVLAAMLLIALLPSVGFAPIAKELAGSNVASRAEQVVTANTVGFSHGSENEFIAIDDIMSSASSEDDEAIVNAEQSSSKAPDDDASDDEGVSDKVVAPAESMLEARVQITGLPEELAGNAVLLSGVGQSGASVSAAAGENVTVTVSEVAGYYVAQVRWAETPEGWAAEGAAADPLAFKPLDSEEFVMPASDVVVAVDYVSIVWDGTIDVTWYDPDSDSFSIDYAAQYAGLSAIVNGIFTAYPTKEGKTEEGLVFDEVDYGAYKKVMGVVEDSSGRQVSSCLYGEFSSTYRLSDSQRGHERTDDIVIVQRVVGDPAYVAAAKGTVGKVGDDVEVTTTSYYMGIDDFDGKSVRIERDLDFGASKDGDGLWDPESPLFMPVGGSYAMLPGLEKTNGYAKISTSWNGVLDGNGHSFSNVYCERYATGNFGDSAHVGLVGRVGIHDADDESLAAVNPTVRGIVLESGLISGRRSVGGIVGKFGLSTAAVNGDGSTGCIVEYCVNKATVIGTDKKGVGGVVGTSWNKGVVRYCANLGDVSVTSEGIGFIAGGIAGSNEVGIVSCYNAGKVSAGRDNCAMAIGTNNGGASRTTDCWWLEGSASGGGYYDRAGDNISDKAFTSDDVDDLASRLNGEGTDVWVAGSGANTLDGVSYPELYFQSSGETGEMFEVVLGECEHGRVSASPERGVFGTSVSLAAEPDAGWALDYFVVNGVPLTGYTGSFALGGDTVVSAVFRPLAAARLTFFDLGDWAEDCTASVVKTGVVRDGDSFVRVEGEQVDAGDEIFEGDVLSILVDIVEGATPGDGERYSGGYAVEVSWGAESGATSKTLHGYTEKSAEYTVTGAEGSVSLLLLELKAGKLTWVEVADTEWFDEDPDASKFSISTPEELAGLAALVNEGRDFAGSEISLEGAIDLASEEGYEWEPIGKTRNLAFSGTFDGGGFAIEGLTISDAVGYAGLFGHVESAVLKKVEIADGSSVSGGTMIGSIVGHAERSEISDCVSNGEVSGSGMYVGGVVGLVTGGKISFCDNAGAVSGVAGSRFVGGIAGCAEASAVLSRCENTGAVSVAAEVGKSAEAGGVVGAANSANIQGCSNEGAVKGSVEGGSLAGARYVGGVVGQVTSGGSLASCVNAGAVDAGGFVAGGLAGFANDSARISDCYNAGGVTALEGDAAGGLVGRIAGSRGSSMTNCYNVGVVSGPAAQDGAGAIAAQVASSQASTFSDVYWLGGTSANAGAFFGGADVDDVCPVNDRVLRLIASVLGEDAWVDGKPELNNGFPLLAWQIDEESSKDPADPGKDPEGEGKTPVRKPSTVLQDGNKTGSSRNPGNAASDNELKAGNAGAQTGGGSTEGVQTGDRGGADRGGASDTEQSALAAVAILVASVALGLLLEARRKSREASSFYVR